MEWIVMFVGLAFFAFGAHHHDEGDRRLREARETERRIHSLLATPVAGAPMSDSFTPTNVLQMPADHGRRRGGIAPFLGGGQFVPQDGDE